jgi:hypothetical protein
MHRATVEHDAPVLKSHHACENQRATQVRELALPLSTWLKRWRHASMVARVRGGTIIIEAQVRNEGKQCASATPVH